MNPIIVAGMHRSGTSAVARLIQKFGVNVGTDLLPATEGNVYGHFEEINFVRFHDALITRHFPDRAPFCEWLPLADSDVDYSDSERAQGSLLWQVHHAVGGGGWKDPRTSLFLDLWNNIIPDAKVIVCLRHPYRVHRSLLRRGEPFLHVDYSAAIAGWTVYNQRILAALSELPKDRYLILDVDCAFKEPDRLIEIMAEFIGVAAPAETTHAIAPEAYHFDDDLETALEHFEAYLPEAGAAYRRLKQLDGLYPGAPLAARVRPSSIGSEEARLIEFEEDHGLRDRAKKMLIQSIATDRQRTQELYYQAVRTSEEKDRLIEDLFRLTECLKQRLAEQEEPIGVAV
jgi:hypothetical protein